MNISYMPYTGIVIYFFSVWNVCYQYSYTIFAYGTSDEKTKQGK